MAQKVRTMNVCWNMKAFQKAQQKLSFGADEPGQANRNLGFFNDQHDIKDELLIFFFFVSA